MKPSFFSLLSAAIVGLLIAPFQPLRAQPAQGAKTVVFQTGFEPGEGYDAAFTLVGQSGWEGIGSGGNGLVSGFFEGFGQQAFIGFVGPTNVNEGFLNVFRPVIPVSASANQNLLKFSVQMQIVTSTNGHSDDFRWSVYNTNSVRLFSIDFDTSALRISYSLEKPTDFVPTTFAFDTLGSYELTVWMNLKRNFWTALLNDVVIINSKPITTTGAALAVSDADAVWAIRDPKAPGDNFMVFDDYRLALVNLPSIPPRLEVLGIGANRAFIVRVNGEEGLSYAVEDSIDLARWERVKVFQAPAGGVFDFEDADALRSGPRFFRVRQVD